jgi:hypothetical protein
VSTEGAARFELLMAALERGNRPLAAGMLVSLPTPDLIAIDARLRLAGTDLKSLLAERTG